MSAALNTRPMPSSGGEALDGIGWARPFGAPLWHREARCREVADPDLFDPEQGPGLRDRARIVARAWCAPCPVRELCLEQGRDERTDRGGLIYGGHLFLVRGAPVDLLRPLEREGHPGGPGGGRNHRSSRSSS